MHLLNALDLSPEEACDVILKWVKEKEAKQEALEEKIRELEARVFYLEEREVMNRRMAYRAIKKAKPKKPEFVEGSSSNPINIDEEITIIM